MVHSVIPSRGHIRQAVVLPLVNIRYVTQLCQRQQYLLPQTTEYRCYAMFSLLHEVEDPPLPYPCLTCRASICACQKTVRCRSQMPKLVVGFLPLFCRTIISHHDLLLSSNTILAMPVNGVTGTAVNHGERNSSRASLMLLLQ